MRTSSPCGQTDGHSAPRPRPCPASAEETFQRALELHRQGEGARASFLYRRVLALCPEHGEACFFLGLLAVDCGDSEEALACFGRARELLPREPAVAFQLGMTHYASGRRKMAIEEFHATLALDEGHWQAAYNLGTACLAEGRMAEAIEAFHAAARHNPQDPDIHFNLGLACKKAGRLEEALQAYLCAMEIAADDAEVHYNLALVYKELGCRDEAVVSLEIAVALRPDYGAAFGNLGVLYVDLDRVEEAIGCYRRLVELDHNAVAARHILAALSGETTASAPSSYIADLFDGFSGHFEERLLVDLEYRTPWDLKALLLAATDGVPAGGRLLDLGCGTGLVGQVFQDVAHHRVGVDLSPRMVEAAAAKNLYDRLEVMEIVEFLEGNDEVFDLIVAADVLIYVGDLEKVFAAIARRLAKGGRLLFSTEQMAGEGYCLRCSGRYAHSAAYVHDLARGHGLRVVASEATNLRKEKGSWLRGDLYLLEAAGL